RRRGERPGEEPGGERRAAAGEPAAEQLLAAVEPAAKRAEAPAELPGRLVLRLLAEEAGDQRVAVAPRQRRQLLVEHPQQVVEVGAGGTRGVGRTRGANAPRSPVPLFAPPFGPPGRESDP